MTFPRYPKYRHSGVPWLGMIPEHWGVGQSRRLFALRNERARETDRQLTASQRRGVIYQEDFIQLEGQRVVQVLKGADILKHVEPNDFVISMRSFQGGIEWSKLRGSISSAYVMLVPCDRVHGRFGVREGAVFEQAYFTYKHGSQFDPVERAEALTMLAVEEQ